MKQELINSNKELKPIKTSHWTSKFNKLPGLGCLPNSLLIDLIKDLLAILGVNPEKFPSQRERKILAQYINGSLKNYSPHEIIKAFQLAIQGKLNVEVYQKLDCIIVGKVMSAYEKYKQIEVNRARSQANTLKREERENRIISPEEKAKIDLEFIQTCVLPSYKNYKASEQWKVKQVHCHIYDLLDRRGLVKFSAEVKKGFIKSAEAILRERIAQKRVTKGKSFQLPDYAKDNDLINIAKSLALHQLYTDFKLNKTKLVEELT